MVAAKAKWGMSDSFDVESLVGSEVVGFHLTECIGEGGMAVVYRGENNVDRTIVRAIKIVHPELARRGQFAKRFAEEARILETLQHPNIVRFFGVRNEQGRLVMELELLAGKTLEERLEAGQIREETALVWIGAAAEGVAAAHAAGIVHRDLKPANLFLTTKDQIKVLDFGIARAVDEANRNTKLTQQGVVPGTPAYMAPEVCEGGKPSERSDVYALGMTLCELLLGYHPYLKPNEPAPSDMQMMFAHVSKPLPDLVEAGVSEPVAELVGRSLSKDPAARFASSEALAKAISDVQSGRPVSKVSDTQPNKGRTKLELPSVTGSMETAEIEPDAPRRSWVPLVAGAASLVVLACVLLILVIGGFQAFLVMPDGSKGSAAWAGCVDGLEVNGGHCCWPGQAWASGACIGEPETCPRSMVVMAEECVCAEGMEQADAGIRCCWPGQVWHPTRPGPDGIQGACVGTVRCPEGFSETESGADMHTLGACVSDALVQQEKDEASRAAAAVERADREAEAQEAERSRVAEAGRKSLAAAAAARKSQCEDDKWNCTSFATEMANECVATSMDYMAELEEQMMAEANQNLSTANTQRRIRAAAADGKKCGEEEKRANRRCVEDYEKCISRG